MVASTQTDSYVAIVILLKTGEEATAFTKTEGIE
jgi:hypothetical protein